MYTIPFMLWTSKQWQANNPVVYQAELSRPYSSANLIHTWADLAGLRSTELDPAKSLVSASFKEQPLLIGDPYQPKSMIDFSLIRPKPQVAFEDKSLGRRQAAPIN
jgi:heptose-I-phosphate ethanolaminephosphotransferase